MVTGDKAVRSLKVSRETSKPFGYIFRAWESPDRIGYVEETGAPLQLDDSVREHHLGHWVYIKPTEYVSFT